jgi:hypothetical protein
LFFAGLSSNNKRQTKHRTNKKTNMESIAPCSVLDSSSNVLDSSPTVLDEKQPRPEPKEEAVQEKKAYVSTRRQFHRFPHRILVETGSHVGHGIQDALDCGFERVISFEVAPDLVKQCKERFKDNPNVEVHMESSRNMLQYIKDIDEEMTVWLDGHYSFGETSHDGKSFNPILDELDALAKHPVKTHTILVDDVRLFGTWEFNHITLAQIIQKVMAINPKYSIQFLDGHQANDIMAFHIPKPI